MINQEYYTVKQISGLSDMTTRNIRNIITNLKKETSESLLFKDSNNAWKIHHLLIPKFKRTRVKIEKYMALNIDPVEDYSKTEIIERFRQLAKMMGENDLLLKIIVEKKLANGRNHIHGYYKTSKNREFMSGLKFWFPSMSYHITDVFDLKGWLSYMTKDGSEIITITKTEHND